MVEFDKSQYKVKKLFEDGTIEEIAKKYKLEEQIIVK